MKCPAEKCGHDAEDHGAFTCWKGCGCGLGKWDIEPWPDRIPDTDGERESGPRDEESAP